MPMFSSQSGCRQFCSAEVDIKKNDRNRRYKHSLLAIAEPLFLVFADERKETSAMGRKWLWFNRRPRSWKALFETHAPCVVCCPQLEPAASRTFVFINSAVTWAHIVNMTSSSARLKECSRKELLSLLPSVLENLHEGKIKKNESRAV